MRKVKIIFHVFFILIYTVAAAAFAEGSILVKSSSAEVSIELPANPTTGYQWVLVKYDQTVMEKPTVQYKPPNTQLIGAPGYSVWWFKFKKSAFSVSQKTQVILEYKRPWEKTQGQIKIISFEIQPD